jgi:hypothetical protein
VTKHQSLYGKRSVLISTIEYLILWALLKLMRIIGTSKVTKGKKIAVISVVSNKLQAEEGDIIVFYEADNGDIIIKKG